MKFINVLWIWVTVWTGKGIFLSNHSRVVSFLTYKEWALSSYSHLCWFRFGVFLAFESSLRETSTPLGSSKVNRLYFKNHKAKHALGSSTVSIFFNINYRSIQKRKKECHRVYQILRVQKESYGLYIKRNNYISSFSSIDW